MRMHMKTRALLAALAIWPCTPSSATEYSLLDLSPYRFGSACSINNAGQVAGSAVFGSPGAYYSHAAVWQDGVVTDLGALGANGSLALHINDAGDAAGYSYDQAGKKRACIWRSGTIADLGAPAGTNSEARGINDRGQVVGSYWGPDFAGWVEWRRQ